MAYLKVKNPVWIVTVACIFGECVTRFHNISLGNSISRNRITLNGLWFVEGDIALMTSGTVTFLTFFLQRVQYGNLPQYYNKHPTAKARIITLTVVWNYPPVLYRGLSIYAPLDPSRDQAQHLGIRRSYTFRAASGCQSACPLFCQVVAIYNNANRIFYVYFDKATTLQYRESWLLTVRAVIMYGRLKANPPPTMHNAATFQLLIFSTNCETVKRCLEKRPEEMTMFFSQGAFLTW